jgi:hypothetical protein
LAADTPPATNGGPVTVALIALEAKRQDDLRGAEIRRVDERDADRERHRIEKDAPETKFRDAAALAEQRRIDANMAKSDAAVLLASTEAKLTASALADKVSISAATLVSTVEASAAALRATNEAMSKAQEARIVSLEQVRYEAAGGKTQRQESLVQTHDTRVQSNWTIERVMTVLLFIANVVLAILLAAKP